MLVLTDQAPCTEIDDGRIRWLAFGEPRENSAIVKAARSRADQHDNIYLELAHYGGQPHRVLLQMQCGAAAKESRRILLHPGKPQPLALTCSADQPCTAWLDQDALAMDNRVALLPDPKRTVNYATAIANPLLRTHVERALTVSRRGISATGAPDLVVNDSSRPAAFAEVAPWSLSIHPGHAEQSSCYVGPFVLDRTHPLCTGLNLDGVIWAADLRQPLPGEPVISAGNVALLTVESRHATSAPLIHMRYSAARSTLHEHPAWPALFWNLLDWRLRETPGPESVNTCSGMELRLTACRATRHIRVVPPTGPSFTLRPQQKQALLPLWQPGRYRIDSGDRTYEIQANFLAPDESDLRTAATGAWGSRQTRMDMEQNYAGTARLWLLLGAVLLTLHMILVHRFAFGGAT